MRKMAYNQNNDIDMMVIMEFMATRSHGMYIGFISNIVGSKPTLVITR